MNPCDDGFVRTSPLASYPPNPWGLHDVYGNVWEWVQDCWNTSYSGAPTEGSAWVAGDCARRGFRGGGYGNIPRFTRSALRNRSEATAREIDAEVSDLIQRNYRKAQEVLNENLDVLHKLAELLLEKETVLGKADTDGDRATVETTGEGFGPVRYRLERVEGVWRLDAVEGACPDCEGGGRCAVCGGDGTTTWNGRAPTRCSASSARSTLTWRDWDSERMATESPGSRPQRSNNATKLSIHLGSIRSRIMAPSLPAH